MFTLCCSDTKWKAGSNCEKTADTKQCAAVGSYGRACARLNAFQFACARLCGESGTSRTFVTMEQRWWGCRGPMLENTRLCTRRYKHPPSPKKHQSNSNRGSPNTPPPLPPQRTTARPAPQGRMMQLQTRRRTRTRFWNPSSASHPRRRHTDPRLARNPHNCQHNQDYYHSRRIPANCAHR